MLQKPIQLPVWMSTSRHEGAHNVPSCLNKLRRMWINLIILTFLGLAAVYLSFDLKCC